MKRFWIKFQCALHNYGLRRQVAAWRLGGWRAVVANYLGLFGDWGRRKAWRMSFGDMTPEQYIRRWEWVKATQYEQLPTGPVHRDGSP